MRQADINRVIKAKEHLRAATILLSNIKWENITTMESEFIGKTKDAIQDADFSLDDILHLCREK
jgi:hypothetical protein